MKGKLKQVKGITLIALVITIIVLLILAGVSIAMLTGQNGILTQANNAKVEQSHGAVREGIALAYNEYQIEINTASNTKLASTETVQIQEEENALASYSSFLDFLSQKGYATLDEDDETYETTGIINVQALTGSRQALGNGTDTDVYKIEEQDGIYVVNYYDEEGTPKEIWNVVNNEGSSKYSVGNIDNNYIGLKDIEKDSLTTFSNAYIIYNGELIDITAAIKDENDISKMYIGDIGNIVYETTSKPFYNGMYDLIIVKDGQNYYGQVGILRLNIEI